MPDKLTQDGRMGVLETPLGKDVLLLNKFDGKEGLNELFEYRIDVLSETENVNFDDAIGKNCGVTIKTIKDPPRYFNGVMTEAQWLGSKNDVWLYRVVLRPWFWLMSHRTDCFIFHEKTVPEIIAAVFGRHSFAKFENMLNKNYPTLEYVVQYRESDMAFVSRLMEEYGISYYFKHEQNEHKLVLCDQTSCYGNIPGDTRIFQPNLRQDLYGEERFTHWIPGRRFTSGKVAYKDYDFKKSTANMKAEKKDSADYTNSELEIYDYPGRYVEKSDGENLAKTRLDIARCQDDRFVAEGDCVSCAPGLLVTLEKHPISTYNTEYLPIRCFHSFIAEEYRTGGQAATTESYHGSYEFMKSDVQYAPQRLTPKAMVHGPQTAVVVGAEGEEIDVDEHGRILVRFHWDRESDQSRRCRLAQVWSGNNWGGIYIPRIGMEVLVEFLEGDPDQPLVTGTVYNDKHKVPYELPDKKTQAGIKSHSTKDGDEDNYNEIMFEDKIGEEFIRMQAEKDLNSLVKNNESRTVGNNRATAVGNEEVHFVGNKQQFTIGKSDELNSPDEEGRVDHGADPADDNSRKGEIGNNDDLFVGNKLFYEAENEIKLKVGSSTITMTQEKITIEAINIEITAQAELKTKGTMVEHKATGIMTIQAPLVKIN